MVEKHGDDHGCIVHNLGLMVSFANLGFQFLVPDHRKAPRLIVHTRGRPDSGSQDLLDDIIGNIFVFETSEYFCASESPLVLPRDIPPLKKVIKLLVNKSLQT